MSDRRPELKRARTISNEPRPANMKMTGSGTGTVLVVDDDDDVRQLAVRFVDRLGYDVLEAKDGASALAVLDSGRHVDLLFTDVVMPGMSGIELWRQAKLRLPSLKVVFASGYANEMASDWPDVQERPIVLRKPYARTDLANVFRRAITGN